MLGLLEEEFPEVCRIVTAVYPSADDDDVITSPYNSVLAMRELTEHADCVLPVENQVTSSQHLSTFFLFLQTTNLSRFYAFFFFALSFFYDQPPPQSLVDIVNKIQLMSAVEKPGSAIRRDGNVIWGRGGLAGAEKPFDAMNNIVANLLLNITRCWKYVVVSGSDPS